MNNKGFTLVEVIAVIVLLGLVIIISSTNILGGGDKAKEKMLETKIKNIEKAAVLYGQDYRNLINFHVDGIFDPNVITEEEYKEKYKLCYKEGNLISNCYYYKKDGKTTITVGFLADNPDENTSTDDAYIEYDDKNNERIKNPIDESKNINNCEIQIYQKYGKVYAVYTKQAKTVADANTKCWID